MPFSITPAALIYADHVLDCIPFVSTISNLADIALKQLVQREPGCLHNPYFRHLESKKTRDCLIYATPLFGNMYKIYEYISSAPVTPAQLFAISEEYEGSTIGDRLARPI